MTEPPANLPPLPADFEFHHVGYACRSVASERDFFAFLGYRQEGASFDDPVQGIHGCFLASSGSRIELLENLEGATTLTPWLDAGIRMYHLAFLVADIDAAIHWAHSQRAKVTVAPVPAVAFGGRRIAFVIFRNGLLLEFIDRA